MCSGEVGSDEWGMQPTRNACENLSRSPKGRVHLGVDVASGTGPMM
jgi:hypothetical protein